MNVAIIGCGLIGRKRAEVFSKFRDDRLSVVCDVDTGRAEAVAKEFGCAVGRNWNEVVRRGDIDAVVVSTVTSSLAEITIASLEAGKHVLCEKPLGRNVLEAKRMIETARSRRLILKTGFNHRFHPAIAAAKAILDEGKIGKCLNIRARYGHGGRPGMESEWRSQRETSGGGELLDQGVHVIDLMRWFGGEITEVFGRTETKFWKIGVEDNGIGVVKTDKGATGFFHVSWTNWRNIFSFEVFGEDGYLEVNGLGGSYGTESLEWGTRNPQGGRPSITAQEFPYDDQSWLKEWIEFRSAVVERRQPLGNGYDGLRANVIVEALYESSRKNAPVIVS